MMYKETPLQASTTTFDQRLRRGILFLLGLNVLLLIVNLLTYPPVLSNGGLPGLVAAAGILLIYGYLALTSPIAIGKLSNVVWRRGVYLGLCSGLILSIDLISGYILHDSTISARTSLVAYGLLLSLIIVSGFIGGRQNGTFRAGITTAVWYILIALLIWFCVEFAAYLLFFQYARRSSFHP